VSGYSVANAILADGTFTARAVTRNTMSESAEKLGARGVQVVQADLSDVESIKKAILRSEGVFGVRCLLFHSCQRGCLSSEPLFRSRVPMTRLSSLIIRKKRSSKVKPGRCVERSRGQVFSIQVTAAVSLQTIF
jgi:NmrA-like family